MHMVVAVLRPAQLEPVRQALAAVHVTRLTICDAQGYHGPIGAAGIVQESVMEIAVNDDFLERTVDTIRTAMLLAEEPATDGEGGRFMSRSDRLFVLPIHDAVQLYRDVRGPEAV
jgi:nitrogen regulatory protein P-II 2